MLKYSQQVPLKEGLTEVDILKFVVDGVAKDVEGGKWEVLAMGLAVVLLPWFVVELSPSPGGIVALLPAEAVVVEGEGLPVGGEVDFSSTVGCPCVRAGELS